MSTAQAGMIGLIMPDQSVAQQQAQQARETIICTCGGVWWSHALRRLQAPTGLGMQLQKSARPDLRACVVKAAASIMHRQGRVSRHSASRRVRPNEFVSILIQRRGRG